MRDAVDAACTAEEKLALAPAQAKRPPLPISDKEAPLRPTIEKVRQRLIDKAKWELADLLLARDAVGQDQVLETYIEDLHRFLETVEAGEG